MGNSENLAARGRVCLRCRGFDFLFLSSRIRSDRALGVPKRIFVGCAELLENTVIKEVVEHFSEEHQTVLELLFRPSVGCLSVFVFDLDLDVVNAVDLSLNNQRKDHQLS